jgi:rhodanese-related sulfurtransferase
VVPGFFGAIQAAEAIKAILGMETTLRDSTLIVDLRNYHTMHIQRKRDPECPVCGSGVLIEGFEISLDEVHEDMIPVDIREPHGRLQLPMINRHSWLIDVDPESLDPSRTYVLVCHRGVSSAILVRELRAMGHMNFLSLAGGAEALGVRS